MRQSRSAHGGEIGYTGKLDMGEMDTGTLHC